MTYPRVCVDENLRVDPSTGQLSLQPWAVPRPVIDVKATSTKDGTLVNTPYLPGKLLIEQKVSWINNSPVDQMLLITVTRGPKNWITSNPNAVQFRDRWSRTIDADPAEPIVSGIFNSQTGSAVDLGTNTTAEPNPGKQYMWRDTHSSDEWLNPAIGPGSRFQLWYRCYVWTPPPWSDNANLNSPQHSAAAAYARIQVMAFPQQGSVVIG